MTDGNELAQIDNLILEEKRNIARDHFNDLWEVVVAEGIEVEIIADELISAVLVELARKNGNETPGEFLTQLAERNAVGAFIPDRTLQ